MFKQKHQSFYLSLRILGALCIVALGIGGCGSAKQDPVTTGSTSFTVPTSSAGDSGANPSAPGRSPSTSSDDGGSFTSVDPTGGTVLCEAAGGVITIFQFKKPSAAPTKLISFSPTQLVPGWKLSYPNCSNPLRWSPDFSMYLVEGVPESGAASHVAVVNIKTGTYTDLTAPRQKSGFSDPVLHESNPRFISDTPTDKFTFGSNIVLIDQLNSVGTDMWITVDRRSPQVSSTPMERVAGPRGYLYPGHPEATLDSQQEFNFRSVSPDGKYLAGGSAISSAADFSKQSVISCSDINPVTASILGWADSTHVIESDGRWADLVMVGTNECTPIIPQTGKSITIQGLSDDGSTLYFDASAAIGASGSQTYAIPIDKPGAEPAKVDSNVPRTGLHSLYARGNY